MVIHCPTRLRGPLTVGESRWRADVRRPAPIRRRLVERVRAEIAAGTYDTPQRFEAALAALAERFGLS